MVSAARLLAVGFGAGLVAGGIAGGLVSYDAGDPDQWWLTGATFGAMLGGVLGVIVQALNLAPLALSVRIHGKPNRWWITPLPILSSILTVLVIAAQLDVSSGRAVTAMVISALIAGVSVVWLAKWCTEPLTTATATA